MLDRSHSHTQCSLMTQKLVLDLCTSNEITASRLKFLTLYIYKVITWILAQVEIKTGKITDLQFENDLSPLKKSESANFLRRTSKIM